MSLIAQCDRCNAQGNDIVTSHKFDGNIVVSVIPTPQAPYHLCLHCIASLMQDAVVSLADTPTAKDYAETKVRAADCSKAYAMVERTTAELNETKERLQEARNQTTAAARYDGWGKERSGLMEQIEAITAARDTALARAASAEKKAADVIKQTQAAQIQSKADEKDAPEYVAAIREREAKRASGRS